MGVGHETSGLWWRKRLGKGQSQGAPSVKPPPPWNSLLWDDAVRNEAGEGVGVGLIPGFSATRSATSGRGRRNVRQVSAYDRRHIAWGARGHRFKSGRPDFFKTLTALKLGQRTATRQQ